MTIENGRTPCFNDPGPWLSDFADDRRRAAARCLAECWKTEQCFKDAIDGGNTWGVWGGNDISRTKLKPRTPAAAVCQNPECDTALMYDGTRRRFCQATCQQRAGYLKKRAVA